MNLVLPDDVLEAIAARAAELAGARTEFGYWTAARAARHLDCEPKRIYKLVRQGRLQQFKEGGRSLFLVSDVKALVEAQPPS